MDNSGAPPPATAIRVPLVHPCDSKASDISESFTAGRDAPPLAHPGQCRATPSAGEPPHPKEGSAPLSEADPESGHSGKNPEAGSSETKSDTAANFEAASPGDANPPPSVHDLSDSVVEGSAKLVEERSSAWTIAFSRGDVVSKNTGEVPSTLDGYYPVGVVLPVAPRGHDVTDGLTFDSGYEDPMALQESSLTEKHRSSERSNSSLRPSPSSPLSLRQPQSSTFTTIPSPAPEEIPAETMFSQDDMLMSEGSQLYIDAVAGVGVGVGVEKGPAMPPSTQSLATAYSDAIGNGQSTSLGESGFEDPALLQKRPTTPLEVDSTGSRAAYLNRPTSAAASAGSGVHIVDESLSRGHLVHKPSNQYRRPPAPSSAKPFAALGIPVRRPGFGYTTPRTQKNKNKLRKQLEDSGAMYPRTKVFEPVTRKSNQKRPPSASHVANVKRAVWRRSASVEAAQKAAAVRCTYHWAPSSTLSAHTTFHRGFFKQPRSVKGGVLVVSSHADAASRQSSNRPHSASNPVVTFHKADTNNLVNRLQLRPAEEWDIKPSQPNQPVALRDRSQRAEYKRSPSPPLNQQHSSSLTLPEESHRPLSAGHQRAVEAHHSHEEILYTLHGVVHQSSVPARPQSACSAASHSVSQRPLSAAGSTAGSTGSSANTLSRSRPVSAGPLNTRPQSAGDNTETQQPMSPTAVRKTLQRPSSSKERRTYGPGSSGSLASRGNLPPRPRSAIGAYKVAPEHSLLDSSDSDDCNVKKRPQTAQPRGSSARSSSGAIITKRPASALGLVSVDVDRANVSRPSISAGDTPEQTPRSRTRTPVAERQLFGRSYTAAVDPPSPPSPRGAVLSQLSGGDAVGRGELRNPRGDLGDDPGLVSGEELAAVLRQAESGSRPASADHAHGRQIPQKQASSTWQRPANRVAEALLAEASRFSLVSNASGVSDGSSQVLRALSKATLQSVFSEMNEARCRSLMTIANIGRHELRQYFDQLSRYYMMPCSLQAMDFLARRERSRSISPAAPRPRSASPSRVDSRARQTSVYRRVEVDLSLYDPAEEKRRVSNRILGGTTTLNKESKPSVYARSGVKENLRPPPLDVDDDDGDDDNDNVAFADESGTAGKVKSLVSTEELGNRSFDAELSHISAFDDSHESLHLRGGVGIDEDEDDTPHELESNTFTDLRGKDRGRPSSASRRNRPKSASGPRSGRVSGTRYPFIGRESSPTPTGEAGDTRSNGGNPAVFTSLSKENVDDRPEASDPHGGADPNHRPRQAYVSQKAVSRSRSAPGYAHGKEGGMTVSDADVVAAVARAAEKKTRDGEIVVGAGSTGGLSYVQLPARRPPPPFYPPQPREQGVILNDDLLRLAGLSPDPKEPPAPVPTSHHRRMKGGGFRAMPSMLARLSSGDALSRYAEQAAEVRKEQMRKRQELAQAMRIANQWSASPIPVPQRPKSAQASLPATSQTSDATDADGGKASVSTAASPQNPSRRRPHSAGPRNTHPARGSPKGLGGTPRSKGGITQEAGRAVAGSSPAWGHSFVERAPSPNDVQGWSHSGGAESPLPFPQPIMEGVADGQIASPKVVSTAFGQRSHKGKGWSFHGPAPDPTCAFAGGFQARKPGASNQEKPTKSKPRKAASRVSSRSSLVASAAQVSHRPASPTGGRPSSPTGAMRSGLGSKVAPKSPFSETHAGSSQSNEAPSDLDHTPPTDLAHIPTLSPTGGRSPTSPLTRNSVIPDGITSSSLAATSPQSEEAPSSPRETFKPFGRRTPEGVPSSFLASPVEPRAMSPLRHSSPLLRST